MRRGRKVLEAQRKRDRSGDFPGFFAGGCLKGEQGYLPTAERQNASRGQSAVSNHRSEDVSTSDSDGGRFFNLATKRYGGRRRDRGVRATPQLAHKKESLEQQKQPCDQLAVDGTATRDSFLSRNRQVAMRDERLSGAAGAPSTRFVMGAESSAFPLCKTSPEDKGVGAKLVDSSPVSEHSTRAKGHTSERGAVAYSAPVMDMSPRAAICPSVTKSNSVTSPSPLRTIHGGVSIDSGTAGRVQDGGDVCPSQPWNRCGASGCNNSLMHVSGTEDVGRELSVVQVPDVGTSATQTNITRERVTASQQACKVSKPPEPGKRFARSPPLNAAVSPGVNSYPSSHVFHHTPGDSAGSMTPISGKEYSCATTSPPMSPSRKPSGSDSLQALSPLPPITGIRRHCAEGELSPVSSSPYEERSARGFHHYAQAQYQQGRLMPVYPHGTMQYSGFSNAGSDCYACSVLTLLLRSPVFCHALSAAPPVGPSVANAKSCEAVVAASSWSGGAYGHHSNVTNETYPTQQRYASEPAVSLHQALSGFARLLEHPEKIQNGISMAPLRSLFPNVFFTGRQEDAHEFFLSIIDRLAEECKVALEKTDRAHGNDDSSPLRGDNAHSLPPCGDTADAAGEPSSRPAIDPARIWVNKLIHGKLLNIIRCRNEGCGHEIATEDPFINISVNLLNSEDSANANDGSPAPIGAAARYGTCTPPPSPVSPCGAPPVESPPTCCYDVQTLVMHSLRFTDLDEYVCDACGSSKGQRQGGCLLGAAPPLLVIQVKRFATTFSVATGARMSRDGTPVRVNEELVLAVLSDQEYDTVEKKFKPSVHAAELAARKQEKGEVVDETSVHINATRCVYRLRGVVRHLGRSLCAGHYVTNFATETLNEDQGKPAEDNAGKRDSVGSPDQTDSEWRSGATTRTWCVADDDRVSIISQNYTEGEGSNSTSCYLLLYEKVEEVQATCHVWQVIPHEAEM
ncbi:putative Ubiquitin carboxyl terminal hydrolase [Trypanosoma vivax]|uniref:ubiquitinyl hydrolase 1 n=1 Tax=Trypanosoma vivax (strain Y486) TaxID=1055687 RepID=G0TVK4_TRYVY|nr:putative ubiquitin hydrolase [Trypanosoma vivax]KAH8620683.1 putative Ubiquitin carboxyl terminal hydrolase [Trypanosoma vivax]CCC47970.1 putative ubiquitin hydrolase [Trypanosoma vivax Y486]